MVYILIYQDFKHIKKPPMQSNTYQKQNLTIESFVLIGIPDTSKEEKKEGAQEGNKGEMTLEPKKIIKDPEKNHSMKIVIGIEIETAMTDIKGTNEIVLASGTMEIRSMKEKERNNGDVDKESMLMIAGPSPKRGIKKTIDFYVALKH